jgi:hypothetical protein
MRSRITWAIVGAVAVIGVFAGLCGEPGATVEPPGFLKDGFAHAETVYAGSEGTPSAANGSVQAVSQYDVACYQVTSNQ